LFGLDICRELVEKQVGCAIGMASGSTFCGVTGSASVACRWDITGPPPVRAARLMQFAQQSGIEVAIDQSVYDDPMAATRLELLQRAVSLKGTVPTVPVYKLSDSNSYAAFRVLETIHGKYMNDGSDGFPRLFIVSFNVCRDFFLQAVFTTMSYKRSKRIYLRIGEGSLLW